MAQQKQNAKTAEWTIIVAVLLGLAIGTAIKRIRVGIILGLAIGVIIMVSSWIRLTRK
jgi:hypothetical protein